MNSFSLSGVNARCWRGAFSFFKTKGWEVNFLQFLLHLHLKWMYISLALKCKLIAIYCNKAHIQFLEGIKWNCFWKQMC